MVLKETAMDIEELKSLVGYALSMPTKDDARPYIQRLKMMRLNTNPSTAPNPYLVGVFGELISAVEAASGQVKEKERLIQDAERILYKLECRLPKDDVPEK